MGSSTNSSSSNGKGGDVAIPANARKIVQSLKEIVNYPDHEIYAILKECNMDPNDAVQKLLSQDTFHEVKSRREKKKEPKESSDYKPRGPSSRGGRSGLDRAASRPGAAQHGSNESGGTRSKSAPKKENGVPSVPSSSAYVACIPGSSDSTKFDSISDFVPLESLRHTGDSDGSTTFSSQTTSGYRSAYVVIPGQPSMADIVRSGRPSNKPPSSQVSAISYSERMNANPSQSSNHVAKQSLLSMPTHPLSQDEFLVSHDHSSKVQDVEHVADITQHVDDGWAMVGESINPSSVSNPSGASVACIESNDLPVLLTEATMNSIHHVDEKLSRERTVSGQPLPADTSGNTFTSNIHMVMDKSAIQDSNQFNDAHFSGHPSCESRGTSFEDSQGFSDDLEYSMRDYSVPEVVEDVSATVSSSVVKMQQLNLRKQDTASSPRTDDNIAVIMPNHLQDPSVDCSHLSFGSFGSGISAAFSTSFPSKASKDSANETCVSAVTSTVDESATRNSEYTAIDQLQVASNENHVPGSLENFDSAPSQPEVVKDINVETAQAQHYPYPSSVTNYAFESSGQATASSSTYPYQQTNSSLPSLSPLSTMMQAYGNPSQGNLLASSAQPVKESDLSFSSFLATQSTPTKFGNAVSSISGPSISIPEAGKQNVFSQSTVQNIPGGSLHATPTLPQVPLQTYSQLPLGHFGNMLSYSYLPQSFAYLPSAFQAYAGNSGYHSSPPAAHGAGMKYSLPQYKSSMSMNSSTPSAPMPAGYGAYGSSGSIPGNFTLNPPSNLGATPTNYDEILASQYKDNSHFLSIPQNESSGMWMHATGSRPVSGLPSSTYYTLQGQQNHQQAILRQMQQISQYAPAGYTNFYHSQSGVSQASLEQQHAQGDATVSQGPTSQQSHQIWAHSF